ncbi:MAG: alpha/beta hydrolase [Rhodospirillales bacterium]|jgi:pimeloyl-ACP methyl ester carboxylesterase|nr:alpha/beta hydrolase [Rhodospirillales bacterium]
MAYATTPDGIRLYYEEAGEGPPIVFVHEFAGDHRSWEPQMRYFARRCRCVTFGARGYPPSDVPEDVGMYSQDLAVADILAVMDHLSLEQAHVVGMSMGGFATLHLGLQNPERALSMVVAGTGYGAEKKYEEYFQNLSLEVARGFDEQGSKEFAKVYAEGASRVQFQAKNPRGWREFADILAEHSEIGAANTMRGVQARRPSLYDLEADLSRMAVPTLIINGDEDDHCLQPGLFLKRVIPACGLLVLPKTGHTCNLEDPDTFNRAVTEFHGLVEAGRWGPRDPRANPEHVMRTR